MPVFISHRSQDDALARQIYQVLNGKHRITCYIDDLDVVAKRIGERAITQYIVDKLNSCTNILAVLTPNTQGSWWVPFEIGVARQSPRFITTFRQSLPTLPEYLLEWPVLSSAADLDRFAEMYKEAQLSVTVRRMLTEKTAADNSAELSEIDRFHRGLKSAIGQR